MSKKIQVACELQPIATLEKQNASSYVVVSGVGGGGAERREIWSTVPPMSSSALCKQYDIML